MSLWPDCTMGTAPAETASPGDLTPGLSFVNSGSAKMLNGLRPEMPGSQSADLLVEQLTFDRLYEVVSIFATSLGSILRFAYGCPVPGLSAQYAIEAAVTATGA